MKEDPAPEVPKGRFAWTGIALIVVVGGFILSIIIIGWLMLAAR